MQHMLLHQYQGFCNLDAIQACHATQADTLALRGGTILCYSYRLSAATLLMSLQRPTAIAMEKASNKREPHREDIPAPGHLPLSKILLTRTEEASNSDKLMMPVMNGDADERVQPSRISGTSAPTCQQPQLRTWLVAHSPACC